MRTSPSSWAVLLLCLSLCVGFSRCDLADDIAREWLCSKLGIPVRRCSSRSEIFDFMSDYLDKIELGANRRSDGVKNTTAVVWDKDSSDMMTLVQKHLVTPAIEVIGMVSDSRIRGDMQHLVSKVTFHQDMYAHTSFDLLVTAERVLCDSNELICAAIILIRRSLSRWTLDIHLTHSTTPNMFNLQYAPYPFVFTYNGWSPGYDYMMISAVRSAQLTKVLKPYCLYSGPHNVTAYHWLQQNNVVIVEHTPSWQDEFWQLVLPFKEQNLQHSHLYADKEGVVGTWQRIDIPIIPVFQQYPYLLFADADTFFRASLTRMDLLQLQPEHVRMAPEMTDAFPYNAGVMIMNIMNLRETYSKFLQFIRSNQHGLYFPDFGPGDQGAYNAYYAESIKPHPLSKDYNAKPYQPFRPSSSIVHFHGAKPSDYVAFFTDGSCRFGSLCADGLKHAFCLYASEWHHLCSMYEICNHVRLACDVLTLSDSDSKKKVTLPLNHVQQ